jgi:hypothetical protein
VFSQFPKGVTNGRFSPWGLAVLSPVCSGMQDGLQLIQHTGMWAISVQIA